MEGLSNLNIRAHFFFFNPEEELLTPPLNGMILPGITRKSILALAKQWVSLLTSLSTYF